MEIKNFYNVNKNNQDSDLSNFSLMDDGFSNAIGTKYCKKHPNSILCKSKSEVQRNKAKVKAKIKKVVKSVKDAVGKVGKAIRNKLRSIMRKDIIHKVKNNIHGTAARLYPAVGTASDVAARKYKKSYVDNSKKVYSELLSRWKTMGGSEADLKSAIIEGSKKGFAKNPFKSADGKNDSEALYNFCSVCDEMESGFDSNTDIQFNADGDDTSTDTSADSSGTTTVEVPDTTEKKKGIRAFFAWFLGLFKKHKADSNPYDDGTSAAKDFTADATEDKGNEPAPSEANDPVLKQITDTSTADDAGGVTDTAKKESKDTDTTIPDDSNDGQGAGSVDDSTASKKILGMSKPIFWSGVSVLGVSLIGLTIWLIRRKK